MTELQLAGLLADLIHREVDDPAELIALGIHTVSYTHLDVYKRQASRTMALTAPQTSRSRPMPPPREAPSFMAVSRGSSSCLLYTSR